MFAGLKSCIHINTGKVGRGNLWILGRQVSVTGGLNKRVNKIQVHLHNCYNLQYYTLRSKSDFDWCDYCVTF